MTVLVPAVQAVVRDELAGLRTTELGIVTQAFTNEGGSGDNNLEVNVRLRGSALELQRVPVAVGRLGLSAVPRAGDLAVLVFAGGDINAAICLGFLYDEQVRPPDAKAAELVYVVPDDANDDDRRLHLELAGGNTLTVQDKKVTVTMGGTTLTIEADGAIALEAAGDITLNAQGKIALEAQQEASVKGMSVKLEGQSEAKLKGATVGIAGMTSFSAG
jgi:phage baseplate assembly protein gpV